MSVVLFLGYGGGGGGDGSLVDYGGGIVCGVLCNELFECGEDCVKCYGERYVKG